MQLEIRRLHRELGVTMVFVTHDQSEAMTLSDRVAVFNQGRNEQLASPQALYDAPANPFVANFLGDNNVITGSFEFDSDQGSALSRAGIRTAGGQALQARTCAAKARATNAMATLCVRPEFLQIAASAGALTTSNCLNGRLLDIIHQGDHWRLVARVDGTGREGGGEAPQWFAKISPGALPSGLTVGQNLCLGFRPEDAWIF
jgi:putative spermidine/putrescine transport system ATP-binding protein